eukprot:5826326-Pleurochrysis_carterae.AAC.6
MPLPPASAGEASLPSLSVTQSCAQGFSPTAHRISQPSPANHFFSPYPYVVFLSSLAVTVPNVSLFS